MPFWIFRRRLKIDPDSIETESGLRYVDIKAGVGEEARPMKWLSVHYTGWLMDGTKFDSSRGRNRPFEFLLGGKGFIKGWSEGITGMKVGGIRKLYVPPELGYGNRQVGKIPPNSMIVFEVELVDVK